MYKKNLSSIFLVLIGILLVLGGCTAKASEDEQIFALFEKQEEAMNDKDKDKYLETMDKKFHNEDMEKELTSFFDENLKHKIKDISIESYVNENQAVVLIKQISYGLSFGETEVQARHAVEKQDGEWKIVNTEILERIAR